MSSPGTLYEEISEFLHGRGPVAEARGHREPVISSDRPWVPVFRGAAHVPRRRGVGSQWSSCGRGSFGL